MIHMRGFCVALAMEDVHMRLSWLVLACALVAPTAALAEFAKVDEKATFMSAIDGKVLRRMGIRLTLSKNGEIEGRAFGRDVTGEWTWNGGYFCRDLTWGKRELEYNCQWVGLKSSRIRFQSDRGDGLYADFRLE